jgi:hypothetical protein
MLHWIGGISVLIFFGMVFEPFCEKIFCVWMYEAVERHERISDKSCIEAKAETLFAVWGGAFAEDMLENKETDDSCG